MPFGKNKPYVKWSDRKRAEWLASQKPDVPQKAEKRVPKPRAPRIPPVSVPCPGCGTPTKPGGKFCSLSCSGKAGRRAQLAWEQSMADAMVAEGWKIFSPTACCDRIGIKDGRVYFLEFKPEGKAALRIFQKSVQKIVPEMYRIVEGTREGTIALNRVGRTRRWQRLKKSPGKSSRFMGVCWSKSKNKWQARISIEGRLVLLGYFARETAAARAYQDALRFGTVR